MLLQAHPVAEDRIPSFKPLALHEQRSLAYDSNKEALSLPQQHGVVAPWAQGGLQLFQQPPRAAQSITQLLRLPEQHPMTAPAKPTIDLPSESATQPYSQVSTHHVTAADALGSLTPGRDRVSIKNLQQEVTDLQSQLQQHSAEASACTVQKDDKIQKLQQEVADLKAKAQQQASEVASAVARAEEQQQAAMEALFQASAHARSAQQVPACCDVLEQV